MFPAKGERKRKYRNYYEKSSQEFKVPRSTRWDLETRRAAFLGFDEQQQSSENEEIEEPGVGHGDLQPEGQENVLDLPEGISSPSDHDDSSCGSSTESDSRNNSHAIFSDNEDWGDSDQETNRDFIGDAYNKSTSHESLGSHERLEDIDQDPHEQSNAAEPECYDVYHDCNRDKEHEESDQECSIQSECSGDRNSCPSQSATSEDSLDDSDHDLNQSVLSDNDWHIDEEQGEGNSVYSESVDSGSCHSPENSDNDLNHMSDSEDEQSHDEDHQGRNNEENPQIEGNLRLDQESVEEGSEDTCQQERANPFEKLKSDLGKTIKVSVNKTVGEVLSNLLSLAKNHNWSHIEKESVMKFTNSILQCGNALPCSRYLLDKYFFSKKDMKYHFFCFPCTAIIGSVPAADPRPARVEFVDPKCSAGNEIHNLSEASYFVTFDVTSQVELILNDADVTKHLVNPVDIANSPPPQSLRDVYDGSMYRDFARRVRMMEFPETYTLSVDSASLCDFCKRSICPCFLVINELPPVLRMKHLILAGLWFGPGKEKMDLFLPPIVKNIIKMSQGFKVEVGDENWVIIAFLIACCADSVARCDIQGIHGHRGEFSCSWCLIEGEEFEDKKRIFLMTHYPSPPRTIAGMVEDARQAIATKKIKNGVRYLSPLASAPFLHPVNGFIVDPMHSVDEGTSKAFLTEWLHGSGPPYYIGAPENLKKIESRLKNVKPPKEFRKNVRKLDDCAYWTGRELQNWALFVCVPVLINILPKRYLKHFTLYVQSIYILLLSKIPTQAVHVAQTLMEEFNRMTEVLYGPEMMRFNLHLGLHFASNCIRWGPMFALNAYGHEGGNQEMKKIVQDSNGISNQVCRGFSEKNCQHFLEQVLCYSNHRKVQRIN